MEEWLDVLLDATLDTLKMVPVLLVVYFLIEILEYKKVIKLGNSGIFKGKASPLFATAFGIIPQCGFSVIATDLFTQGNLTVGALIAIYIATSDEALPMMLSNVTNPKILLDMLALIGVKVVFAISAGYLVQFIYNKIFKETPVSDENSSEFDEPFSLDVNEGTRANRFVEKDKKINMTCNCSYCSGNSTKFVWQNPLLKTLRIAIYVFVINLILGTIIMFIGEEKIAEFLQSSYAVQPIFAVLVGLIPNCAASIILTELYIEGGLTFGSIIAGLSVNAGLGMLFLIKNSKNVKKNVFIISSLITLALIVGYAIHYIAPLIA